MSDGSVQRPDRAGEPAQADHPGPANHLAAEGHPVPEGHPGRPPGAVQVRLRRAPKYLPFVLTGVVVGVLLGAGVALALGTPPGGETFSIGSLVRYFAAVLGLLGGIVGAGAALLVERRRS